MNLKLDAWTLRSENDIDLSEPFTETIDEETKYAFRGGFNIYSIVEDEFGNVLSQEKAATVYGLYFDEDKILNEGESMVNIADMYDADTCGAIAQLVKSKLYKQDIDENKMLQSLFSCYIEHVYIEPKFRNHGIGRYIFENFDSISQHCFNTPIHCLVICPKPQERTIEGDITIISNKDDSDGVMLAKMIKILKKNGFIRLGNSEFYVLNCAL